MMRAKFTRLLREKRARRDPAARYERGGSSAARGKRVNFARINTPVINLYESVQKECLGIPIFKPYREKLDTYALMP
ncbi:hypothetical protein BIZ35_13665 [Heyndrickxia coagulans]|nr:hypothetical protein BIZ35_13665 [Heyndrickxia coagulans]